MDNISCCIIAVQKDESNISHWIDYHLQQGFSHIFILDNNDIGNELSVKQKCITILPANSICDHHISRIQSKLYNFVLDYILSINSIKQLYTHVLCIDVDEYFYYSKGNINDFIKNELTVDAISIPWICYDDNDIILKSSLQYNNPIQNYTREAKNKWIFTDNDYKTLAKIDDNLIKLDIHYVDDLGIHGFIDRNIAHIKHYRTQCLEEYMDKVILRKCWDNEWWYDFGENTVKFYFNYNEVSNKKLEAFKYFFEKYNLKMSDSDKQFIENNYKRPILQ